MSARRVLLAAGVVTVLALSVWAVVAAEAVAVPRGAQVAAVRVDREAAVTYTEHGAVVARVSLPVPHGYRRALITATADLTGWLDRADPDQLVDVHGRINVASVGDIEFGSAGAGIGSPNTAAHGSDAVTLHGLNGPVTVNLWANGVYAAPGTGDAVLTVSAVFLP